MSNLASPLTALGVLLGLLPIAACGAADRGQRLEGTWVLQNFPTEKGQKPCLEEMTIDAGKIASTLSCLLKEGTYGQQITVGEYQRRETQVTVAAFQSTCPQQPRTPTVWLMVVDGDELQKTVGNVTTTYDRGRANIKDITVSGCFDAKLETFDEGPLYTLP